jgi:hypothetical protein
VSGLITPAWRAAVESARDTSTNYGNLGAASPASVAFEAPLITQLSHGIHQGSSSATRRVERTYIDLHLCQPVIKGVR